MIHPRGRWLLSRSALGCKSVLLDFLTFLDGIYIVDDRVLTKFDLSNILVMEKIKNPIIYERRYFEN